MTIDQKVLVRNLRSLTIWRGVLHAPLISGEARDYIVAAIERAARFEDALRAIKQATIDGAVCDDVAWFSKIETLHDFCDRILDETLHDYAERLEVVDDVTYATAAQGSLERGDLSLKIRELEAALRSAFPHFEDDEPITPEAIRRIGHEHVDMIMCWEPQRDEIEFLDHDGKTHKIINEPGDYEVGINSGWVLSDDSDLVSAAQGKPDCGAWRLIETAPFVDDLSETDPERILVWVEDGGSRGEGAIAFGYAFRGRDGSVRLKADGYMGFKVTLWRPMPAGPAFPSTDRLPDSIAADAATQVDELY
jgi:hypothetical protein